MNIHTGLNMIFPILTEEVRKLPLYVTSVGGMREQEAMGRPGGFPDWHWLHVASGAGRLELGGKEYILRAGMGFLMAPGVPHRYEPVDAPWMTRFVTFGGSAAAQFVENISTAPYGVYRLRNAELVDQGIERIQLACSSNDVLQAHEASAFLHLFLVTLTRSAVAWDARVPLEGEGGFQEVIRHIESHFAEPLSLDALAAVAKVTPQHLCRLFRRHVNARPFEYITRVRLQKAKAAMLSRTEWPLKQIAEACGFGDPSYFTKQFHQYEGMTPQAFRRMYGG